MWGGVMYRLYNKNTRFEAFRAYLSRLWQKEHTPLVLAVLLCLAVYIVATSKLIDYIVGGL